MRTPTAKTISLRSLPQPIDVGVLELLFDQVPDVAFFVKDTRAVRRRQSVVGRAARLAAEVEAIGKCPSDICPGDSREIPAARRRRAAFGPAAAGSLGDAFAHPASAGLVSDDQAAAAGWRWQARRTDRVFCATRQRQSRRSKFRPTWRPHWPHSKSIWPRRLLQRRLPRAGSLARGLARLMKRFFGLTPSQYIAKTRIAAASNLLRETDQSSNT